MLVYYLEFEINEGGMPLANGTYDPALKLWVVLNRVVRSIAEPLRRQVEAHGLSFTEFGVLEVLLHKGPLPIGEIGGHLLLGSGSMTYVIDKLERRGLLERRACEADRRIVFAALTPAGEALITPVFDEHRQLVHRLMAGLNASEQQAAIDLLKRLGRHAQQVAAAVS
ncbi:MarR family transcriptional regulator [Rhodocaloribacter litoris]|uniref:MarR family winged helix-turn-helix transcriptional regulator n=1 Tax=Rhodocaloribacter litoris TaxID=2558931 RepID=UPI001E4C630A|nr:MarR family transcriptional regulator [Rhodocaloribacter litoris]QXD16265.1 MarR family transcriptional regulator [Rhodocaloribacter litoris]